MGANDQGPVVSTEKEIESELERVRLSPIRNKSSNLYKNL